MTNEWTRISATLPPWGKLVDLWADGHRCADWMLLEVHGQLAFWHNGACRHVDEVTHWRYPPSKPEDA